MVERVDRMFDVCLCGRNSGELFRIGRLFYDRCLRIGYLLALPRAAICLDINWHCRLKAK